jgi:hypothetical protein
MNSLEGCMRTGTTFIVLDIERELKQKQLANISLVIYFFKEK